jgi:hypothetical protein
MSSALPTLINPRAFSGEEGLHEIKHDNFRGIARKIGSTRARETQVSA